MITSSNVGDILFKDCEGFGIARYRKGNEKIDPKVERVVIRVQRQQGETVWRKGFGLSEVDPMTIREELERLAWQLLDSGYVGEFDGTKYTYRIHSTEPEIADEETKCHYVNVKLLFNVFNIN